MAIREASTANYFAAGNMWLFTAVVLLLGRNKAYNGLPLMYSFFGLGAPMHPLVYNGLMALCLSIAVACFFLTWTKSKRAGKGERDYAELA